MLPDEIWEIVLMNLDLFELLRLKRVSKHWNELITRVIKRSCKWYEKCVAEIPEDAWSSILNHQTQPEIRCENFHEGKIYPDIWMTMYRSWIGWNTLTEKNTSYLEIKVFGDVKFLTNMFCAVTGNIVAVGSGGGQILFYDIAESTVTPIYQVYHGAPIGDLVLCRNGSDVMAISYSINDLRYWDLRTKTQIHQMEFHRAGRIIKADFNYCYSLSCDGDTWVLNVEKFASGTVKIVRRATLIDPGFVFKAMGTDGDQVTLMASDGNGHKYWANYPDNRNEALSYHEDDDEASHIMFRALNSCFKIFKPCVATYIGPCGKYLGLSVNAKAWKIYDVELDLGIEGSISAILYHIGFLMIAIEHVRRCEAEVRLYPIEDINTLDNLDFKSMKYKTFDFLSHSIDDLAVTEFNSSQYLLASIKTTFECYFIIPPKHPLRMVSQSRMDEILRMIVKRYFSPFRIFLIDTLDVLSDRSLTVNEVNRNILKFCLFRNSVKN